MNSTLSAALEPAGFFDASPNPYLVLDRRLHIVGANKAYLASVKRDLADIVGRWAWDAFPTDPETLGQAIASFERVIRTGQPDTMPLLRFDVPRPEAEGGGMEERYWSITHSPVPDAAGEVGMVLQHPVDVTELQRLRDAVGNVEGAAALDLRPAQARIFERAKSVYEANLALKAESDHLHEMFRQAPGFMAVLREPDHRFELTNDAYRSLIGGRDVIGLTVREALVEIEGQPFLDLLDLVYATGQPFIGRGVEILLEHRKGEPRERRSLDFIYQPIRDASGSVVGIFVEGSDVTEMKAATDELREREQRLRLIVEAATDYAILTLDADRVVTSWSAGAEGIFGYAFEEIVGRCADVLFTPEDREAGQPADE